MDLTPEQFARLNQWFDEALDLPVPERAPLIERCAGKKAARWRTGWQAFWRPTTGQPAR